MFKELLPLLATRSVILTAGTVQDDVIRVTVTPRPKGKDEAKEVTQPFIVEGTAEELDSELPKAIVEYTGQMLNHERALEQVKSNMDKALAEAKAEADKKIAEAKNKSKSTTSKTPATKTTEKPEPQKEAAPPSLFDAPAATTAESNPAPAPVAATTEPDDEDDDDDPNDDSNSEGSDESEESGSDVSEQPAPEVVSVPAAAASATAQPTMFDNPRFDEEQAILEEAFNGAENDLIAA